MLFFFKQKTAYEMRISDWSSDVCSSDLLYALHEVARHGRYRCGGQGRGGQGSWRGRNWLQGGAAAGSGTWQRQQVQHHLRPDAAHLQHHLGADRQRPWNGEGQDADLRAHLQVAVLVTADDGATQAVDRKSTRLNSRH